MKLLTKIKVFLYTGILVVAGAAAHSYIAPRGPSILDQLNHTQITLVSVFENPGTQGILPTLSVTGFDATLYPPAYKSPFRETTMVPKGSRIVFSVTQMRSGYMSCAILRDGRAVAQDDTHAPVTLPCHTVIS